MIIAESKLALNLIIGNSVSEYRDTNRFDNLIFCFNHCSDVNVIGKLCFMHTCDVNTIELKLLWLTH